MKTRTYLSTHSAPKLLSRRLHALLCLAFILALAACSSPLAPLPAETSATISDTDIDAAALELTRSQVEIQGSEGSVTPEGPETDLSASTELSPQAVLPSVGGPLVFIRNVPGSAAPWQLWLADQATDVSTLLYSGTRQIGSTAVDAGSNLVFFTMQAAAGSSNYEVYRLTRSSGGVTRLTNTSAAEADVSVSANGQTVVWGGLNSAGRRAVYLREYSGSTYTQKILSVSGGHQFEPSVSGDGAYVALVRQTSGTNVMRFRKSNSSYTSVVSGSSSVTLRHPSVSNGGGKVMWLEQNVSNSGSRIRVKTLSSGATATALSSTSVRFRHPHLTSDGAFFTYGAPSSENSAFQVFTRNLSTGQTARVTLENAPTGHDGMFWQKTAGSSATVTIRGTVTQGTGTSSFEATDEAVVFDDHGKVPLDAVTPSSDLPRLRTLAQQSGSVRVVVHLNVPFTPEGEANRAEVTAQRSAIANAQRAILNGLSKASVRASHTFETVPALALTVDAAGIDALANSPLVAAIQEDFRVSTSLAESTTLIGANRAWSAGYDGGGWTVAVLDEPTDTTHSFLSGRVVDEGCFVSDSSCPNGTNQQTGLGASVPNSNEDHGTHVSGIALGRGSSFSGVARGANLMAVKVLSNGGGSFSDVLRGLEYVYSRRSVHSIAAVNLSLGGSSFTSSCDSAAPTMKTAIDNLRSVGIATVAASGNDGYTNAISIPACISSAISIGSTGDGSSGATVDRVSSFSNSASFLDFLAPGQWINSSVPGGGFANFSGTSMATPHVAGAWAVLKQRFPSESVNSIYNRLASTGMPVTDTRNSVTKPRIQLDAALGLPTQPPPVEAVRVKLFRSATGALVREVAADSSGAYSFTSVPADSYYVVAYADQNGNGRQDSTERAGAFGNAAVPQVLNATSGSYTANITTGTPTEREPNDGLGTTNRLLLSTHINGSLTSSNTDFFSLQVPSSGSYTLETSGDCTGSRADTILELYTTSGTTLASDDDGAGNLCSRITYSFTQAGNYVIQVRGFNGDTGGYTLSFRQ